MLNVWLRGSVLFCYLCLGQPLSAYGQNFSIPENWRKPSSTISRPDRISRAQAAIDSLIPSFSTSNGTVAPLTGWESANLLASIAQLDYISGGQKYRDLFKMSLAEEANLHPDFFDPRNHETGFEGSIVTNSTRDPIMWGLTAFYGHRAYGNDTDLLNTAASLWDSVQKYIVSPADARAGTQQSRNGTFQLNCIPNSLADDSLAGAVFWLTFPSTDFRTLGESISAYVTLSAHLWEVTGNDTYLASANQSAVFMTTNMWAPSNSSSNPKLFFDAYDLQHCDVPSDEPFNIVFYSYDQGFFMEGLSILSTSPLDNNATWATLLQTLVDSTTTFYKWTTLDGDNAGVMNETSSVQSPDNEVQLLYKDVFIRALSEIWNRTSPTDPMSTYIQAFITVQYNALLDYASEKGNVTVYPSVWLETAVDPSFEPWSQLEAMTVLNAAVAMPPSSNSSGSLSGGAIAGVVAGAIFGALLFSLGVLWVIRRSRRAALAVPSSRNEAMASVEPFHLSALGTQPSGSSGTGFSLPAGWVRKNRNGDGPSTGTEPTGTSTFEGATHPVPPSTATSAETVPPGELSETSITRLVNQVLRRLQSQEAPPSYRLASDEP